MYSFLSVRKSNVLLDIVYKMQSIQKTSFRSFLQFEEDYETWTTVVVVACIVVVVVVLMMLLLLVLFLLLLLFGRRFKVEHDTRVHTPSVSPITHGHKTKVFSAIDFFCKNRFFQ
jgi:hypothetical protein